MTHNLKPVPPTQEALEDDWERALADAGIRYSISRASPENILRSVQTIVREKQRPATVADIADALDIPRTRSYKALMRLQREGLLVARQGGRNNQWMFLPAAKEDGG